MAIEAKRYQHIRQLGVGGMGEVWLAMDTVLARQVAVKYMQVTAPDVYKNFFVNEARILASLNHPNITAVHDAVLDSENNQFYFVMEYVEGESLERLLEQNGAFSLDISLDIAIKLLQALKYAHQRDVIHRDLKPANIMIADDVKLTDFGLADLASRLKFGFAYSVGTPGYISPEQAAGDPTDARSDLYAFGVVLFNMLTGNRSPFEALGSWPATPQPLRQVAPNAPVALERVILRLLAEKPAERFTSADEVINVLGAVRRQIKLGQRQFGLLEADPKPLIGRASELQVLRDLWGRIQQAGQPSLLMLHGGPGVGKRRLVSEFIKTVMTQDETVLSARCDELRSPYMPFVEIFETIFAQGLAKIPEPETARVILRQMPGLAGVMQLSAPADRVDSQVSQWSCFEALDAILCELGPTLIFLDNARYLDRASAALLRYILRRNQFAGLVIGSVNTAGQIPAQIGNLYPEDYQELLLEPLPLPEFHQHLNSILGGEASAELVDVAQRHSAGNLFHAEEIVRYWLQTRSLNRNDKDEWTFASPEVAGVIPAPLTNILKRQVMEKLTDTQRQTLAVAAMLGSQFDFPAWVSVLGGPAQMAIAVDALDRALSLAFVREAGPESYAFYPPGLPEVLIATLSMPHQRLTHQQIAEYLSKSHGDPLNIAHHFMQAGFAAQAARSFEEAGARAADANLIQQAISLYSRAAELQESVNALESLGKLYRIQGQSSHARQALLRAHELARQAGDRDAEARVLNGLAFVLWLYDAYADAQRVASSVLKLEGISDVHIATAESHLGMVAWLVGRLAEAEQHCRRAVELLRAAREFDTLGGAYSRLALIYFSMGRLNEAEETFNYSLIVRGALKDWWGEGFLRVNLGRIALERGDFNRAWSLMTEASDLFEKIESRDGLMVTRTNQGQALLRHGRAQEALDLLEEAAQIAGQIGKISGYGISEIYIFQAQAALALNNPYQAQLSVEEALKIVTAAENREYIARGQLVLAQVFAVRGRVAEADALYQKALALAAAVGCALVRLQGQWQYANFLAARGEMQRANTLKQEASREAQLLGFALPPG